MASRCITAEKAAKWCESQAERSDLDKYEKELFLLAADHLRNGEKKSSCWFGYLTGYAYPGDTTCRYMLKINIVIIILPGNTNTEKFDIEGKHKAVYEHECTHGEIAEEYGEEHEGDKIGERGTPLGAGRDLSNDRELRKRQDEMDKRTQSGGILNKRKQTEENKRRFKDGKAPKPSSVTKH